MTDRPESNGGDAPGAVRQADRAVGRVLRALEDAGLANATFVLFISDHGLAMPRAKCTLYDPGLEIAALMRWPDGGIAGGIVVNDLISNIDLLPTLFDAIDVPIPAGVQGRSFLPCLRGEHYTPRSAVFAEKTYHSYYDPMRAIRTERFKYIHNFEPTPLVEVPGDVARGAIFRANVERYYFGEHPPAELYDLQLDPLEQYNLAGAPEYAQTQAWLDGRLVAWMRETGDALAEGVATLPGIQAGDATAGRPRAC
ncbi:MAG TPA: sulfatase/phosphatase domain-containing protein [Chloroflexota bacterium]